MTENEAIREFQNIRPHSGMIPVRMEEAVDTAIKALEEVQQYRQIGSVELFAETKKLSDLTKKCGTIGKVFDECAEYVAIGTVEECRKAVEKQTAISRELIEGKYFCPKCHNLMPYPGYCGCGQKVY